MLDGPLRLYSAFYVRASCARAPRAARSAASNTVGLKPPPLWVALVGCPYG